MDLCDKNTFKAVCLQGLWMKIPCFLCNFYIFWTVIISVNKNFDPFYMNLAPVMAKKNGVGAYLRPYNGRENGALRGKNERHYVTLHFYIFDECWD